jgi:hypothetical protein
VQYHDEPSGPDRAAGTRRRRAVSGTLLFLFGYCMLAAGVTSAAGLSLAFAGDYLRACCPGRSEECSPGGARRG